MVDHTEPGAGEPLGIRAAARTFEAKASQLRRVHETILGARQDASGEAWTGKAQVAFAEAVDTATPELQLLADGLETQAAALHSYAAKVERIKDEQVRLRHRIANAESDLARSRQLLLVHPWSGATPPVATSHAATQEALSSPAGTRQQDDVADCQRQLTVLQREWDALVERRARADAACSAALTGARVLGTLRGFATSPSASDPDALLTLLAGLSAVDLRVLLTAHPELAERIAAASPDAVAAWWASMDSPQTDPALGRYIASDAQAALIALIPRILGNLEGVAYWARHQANMSVLAEEIDRLQQNPGADASELAALRAIRSEAGAGLHENPPRELMSLVLDRPPLAAVSVGDLDRATRISFIVPGMNTTVAHDMKGYVTAARGLMEAQRRVSGLDIPDLAVVAWLGYHPPMDSMPLEVAYDGRAIVGAPRLAHALEGVYSARASGKPVEVSVVAHSYGTDVAALALREAHADHVVLLGSAGVSLLAPNANLMNVPAGEVFATQGRHDGWAPVGQVISGRIDPTSWLFGAHVFSSEASTVAGRELHEVTMHGPLSHESGAYSYLDNDTTAQYGTALATMGRGAEVPAGGTRTGRLLDLTRDGLTDLIDGALPKGTR